MATRSESAAATRQSLTDAAGVLLDPGGPEAVTLREVGARSGVSRSAAYRHFAAKEPLLAQLAADGLSALGDALEALVASENSAEMCLRSGLLALIDVGRNRLHRYRLMRPSERRTCSSTSWLVSPARDRRTVTVLCC